ncbi:MAG: EamA family transporter [Planctomycetes bacterium]|nr:EamA family transporter [Planctomycetota bacterium]
MKAILLAVTAGLCWGVGELCTKSVLHGGRIGPLTAIAVRSTVALPLLWLAWYAAVHWLAFEARPAWRELPASDVAKLVLGSGLLAGGLAMICFYSALALDDVSRIKPIAFTVAPATAAVLGWMLLGEAMSWRKALAVALILGGVLLLTSDRPRSAPHAAAGDSTAEPR